jgi:hypothetical protein
VACFAAATLSGQELYSYTDRVTHGQKVFQLSRAANVGSTPFCCMVGHCVRPEHDDQAVGTQPVVVLLCAFTATAGVKRHFKRGLTGRYLTPLLRSGAG